MNTEEAIEFLGEEDYMFSNNLPMKEIYEYSDKLKEVVNLLKRSEKYEAMWGEFYKEWKMYGMHFYDINADDTVGWAMEKLEQKYFPKHKSIRQRINDMLDNLNTMGRAVDIKDLTNLLIELRYKESDDA